MDLIDRQAIHNTVIARYPDSDATQYSVGYADAINDVLKDIRYMPSAEPERHESSRNALCIRKTDALKICMEQIESPINTYFEKGIAEIIKKKITELPSAEPETANEKEKRDLELWNAITTAIHLCGLNGEDVTAMSLETLRQLGRYDLLPPCER